MRWLALEPGHLSDPATSTVSRVSGEAEAMAARRVQASAAWCELIMAGVLCRSSAAVARHAPLGLDGTEVLTCSKFIRPNFEYYPSHKRV